MLSLAQLCLSLSSSFFFFISSILVECTETNQFAVIQCRWLFNCTGVHINLYTVDCTLIRGCFYWVGGLTFLWICWFSLSWFPTHENKLLFFWHFFVEFLFPGERGCYTYFPLFDKKKIIIQLDFFMLIFYPLNELEKRYYFFGGGDFFRGSFFWGGWTFYVDFHPFT